MRKALKRHGSLEAITTDGLRSYGAAMDALGNREKQEMGRSANSLKRAAAPHAWDGATPVQRPEADSHVISQRMLAMTPSDLQRDALVTRTVLPTKPPQVEYALTPLGR